jgi:hypothetical protein
MSIIRKTIMQENLKAELENFRTEQFEWLRKFVLRFPPGKVPFAAEGSLLSPGPRAGLSSCVFALKAAIQTRLWEQLSDEFKKQWTKRLNGFQSIGREGASFYRDEIIDPMLWTSKLTYRLRRRQGELVARSDRLLSESRQAVAVLEYIAPGAAQIPIEYFRFPIEEKLRALKTNNPWGSISHIGHIAFFAKLSEKRKLQNCITIAQLREMLLRERETIKAVLSSNFGTPSATGGAMKLVLLCEILGTELLQPEFLVDAALSCDAMDDVCQFLNPLVVLEKVEQSNYRSDDITRFRFKRMENIKNFIMPDGGFAFTPQGSTTNYAGIKTTRGLRVGDVHAAHILSWAVYLLEKSITGETPWLEPPT